MEQEILGDNIASLQINNDCTNIDGDHCDYFTIAESHKDNWANKWDQYPDVYEMYFHRFIDKNPTYLEVGVQNGGSIQIMDKYLKNANIFGVDIDSNVCNLDLKCNATLFCFDINNMSIFQDKFGDTSFDIILDDGSHVTDDVINTFKNLFPKLKADGIFLIEDLLTSYWPVYKGGYLLKESSIEFLKHYIDIINGYYINDYNIPDFIKNLSEDDKYALKWIESIHFHDSVAVIKKRKQERVSSYKAKTFGINRPIM